MWLNTSCGSRDALLGFMNIEFFDNCNFVFGGAYCTKFVLAIGHIIEIQKWSVTWCSKIFTEAQLLIVWKLTKRKTSVLSTTILTIAWIPLLLFLFSPNICYCWRRYWSSCWLEFINCSVHSKILQVLQVSEYTQVKSGRGWSMKSSWYEWYSNYTYNRYYLL